MLHGLGATPITPVTIEVLDDLNQVARPD